MTIPEEDILNASILVVDDQPANITLLTQMLEEAGYRHVSSTVEAEQVCAMHREHHYDLILLDLQMPQMDGFAVMEGLKTNHSDPYLSVLVITAQPGHKLRALKAGARDFVSKPFDLVEAKTRIRNMLEVRLLYKRLEAVNHALEERVQQRTAELRESEARYRSLTELASDWYWEQDESGQFSKASGPVLEMLGMRVPPLGANVPADDDAGWDPAERAALQATIAARQPFIDRIFKRTRPGRGEQTFRISGEPMFDQSCRYIGYRGVGVELTSRT